MDKRSPPRLGAAMPVETLVKFNTWLIEGQRDLEIQDACAPEVLDGDWRGVVRQAHSLLDGYRGRLGIHGPFMGLTLVGRDPKVRTLVTDRLRQGVEFAHAVGATHMVVHSPFPFFGSPAVAHSPGHGLSREVELAHLTLDPIVTLAADARCMLVIENIYDLNSAPLLALIRSFNSPYVRLSVDTGHAFVRHQIGGPPPDQWVRDGGDLLAHVHLQDSDGQLDRHWTPGRGQINWYAFFEALQTLAGQPRLMLELGAREEIPAAVQWLTNQGWAE